MCSPGSKTAQCSCLVCQPTCIAQMFDLPAALTPPGKQALKDVANLTQELQQKRGRTDVRLLPLHAC